MTADGDVYGKRTLDFFERLQRLSTYDDISREIRASLEWFGLTRVTAWSMPVPGRSPDDCVLLNSRPADYLAHYAKNNLCCATRWSPNYAARPARFPGATCAPDAT